MRAHVLDEKRQREVNQCWHRSNAFLSASHCCIFPA